MSEYKHLLKEFMESNGEPMQGEWDEQWKEWDVSTYGWHDWNALWHMRDDKCPFTLDEGAVLKEETFSMFTDTFHDNENEVGLVAHPARCACGKYTGMPLRWVGSLGEAVRGIMGIDATGPMGIEL